ncbi:MAG: glycosyltransferase [Eubacteriales bacterium]|nr:glycosyltransferase [Eubacteriales bacterium]
MKITAGQFNESFPPIVDGVANVVQNYAYWMNKKYGSCCVVTPKHPDAVDDFDFNVHRYSSMKVPTRNEYRFGLPQMDTLFWKGLKKIPFDIVHAHCPFSSGLAARSIAKKRGIPFVATFHSKFREDFKAALKSDKIVESVLAGIASFYESADEVWVVNEASTETLREYGYTGDVYVMENGCDIEVRQRSKEADRDINTMFGLDADVPLFMYIGQHTWQKNLKIVIEALKLVKDKGQKFHMLFVGDGPRRADMKRMAEDFGLDSFVTFAGKIYDRDVIAKIYLRSSAMLFPSLYDTSSLVPKEAAACGCPTVFVKGASTSQGISELNGFLIENTAASLADMTAYIISNPDTASEIGDNARRTVYRSWEDAIEVAYERYLYLIDVKKNKTLRHAK